jgi:hypothetical protein
VRAVDKHGAGTMIRSVFRAAKIRVARSVLICVASAPWAGACNAKSAVVCDKLEGCGLLSGSADECVETIRRGFADDGVDGQKLTQCIDCVSIKFCDELRSGACEEDCGEVLQELRNSGILPPAEAGAAGAGPD